MSERALALRATGLALHIPIPLAPMAHYDVIVLGAGASGFMCAMEAGRRGRKVLVSGAG